MREKTMKNKYITKWTEEDIVAMLARCNIKLAYLTDDNGEDIYPIEWPEKDEGEIVVRCVLPDEMLVENEFFNSIAKKNPKLAQKFLMPFAMFSGIKNDFCDNVELAFIDDYFAYFPFERDKTLPNGKILTQAHYQYNVEKFGVRYERDFEKNRQKIEEMQEKQQKEEQDCYEL